MLTVHAPSVLNREVRQRWVWNPRQSSFPRVCRARRRRRLQPSRNRRGRNKQFYRGLLKRVLGNIHQKVISASQELLVPGPVASLTLSVSEFSVISLSSHVLNRTISKFLALEEARCHAPPSPVTGSQRQSNFAGEGGLVGSKWETVFLNTTGFVRNWVKAFRQLLCL